MSRVRRGLLGTIVGVLALSACGGALPPSAADRHGASAAETVFSVGYDRIAEVYLRSMDLGALTVDGLAGLAAIDPALGARRSGAMVELISDGQVIGRFAAPRPDDARGWAALTTAAVARGQQASPALRDADAEEIYEAVFAAITAELDPYSRYVGAQRAKDERAFRDGYGGIGLLLHFDDAGRALIQRVFKEGPAFQAGVETGSVILAVDGTPVGAIGLDDLSSRLRGPVNSVVHLTVAPPSGGTAAFALRREQVIPNAVQTRYENGVAILEVSRFNAATSQHAAAAIREAVATLGPGGKGIILDLRGNPGGLLSQSVAVADLFIPRGQIISTRGRHPDSVQYFDADRDDLSGGLPLVVLVDGNSASAAEVVAAALQDSGRAVVVGASSYGKGSVQTVTRLPNDGELFLTWSRIYAPAGYTLHQQGVMPTICTSAGIDDAKLLLSRFRSGELTVPAGLQNERRAAPDDAAALEHLRSICPWQEHDGALDVTVAEMLLADRELYAKALAVMAGTALASAVPLDTAD